MPNTTTDVKAKALYDYIHSVKIVQLTMSTSKTAVVVGDSNEVINVDFPVFWVNNVFTKIKAPKTIKKKIISD